MVLVDVVVEQLGDQVDVSEDHSPAAVSLETKFVQGLALWRLLRSILAVLLILASNFSLILLVLAEEVDVLVVLVAGNLGEDERE